MKKHDEGYVLPLVLVVMVVLCLVAVSVMSFALNNYKSQQASVQRMQDQYAAQGEIEKVVAKIAYVTDQESVKSICGQEKNVTASVSHENEETLVELKVIEGTVQIACTLSYDRTSSQCVYKSYEISTADPAEEGGSAGET